MYRKLFQIFFIITCIYAGFIYFLSSRSHLLNGNLFHSDLTHFVLDLLHNIGHIDKFGHIGLYFVFGFLLFFTFHYSKKKILQKNAVLFAILTGLTYGLLDEIHQYFVPGRTASIMDLLADLIGLTLAQICIIIIISLSKKN